ncbi:MAG: ferritin-like domain-containing protein [Candidatus Bathyarchaeia archaeon]|jgi:rubrerythrin
MSLYSCLALIEHETDLLYEAMVEKAEDRKIQLLLDVILQETKGHHEIFKHLARLFDQTYPPAIPDCKKVLGTIFTDSLELTRNLKDSVQNGMPLSEAMRKLVSYEGSVGEEYTTLIHSRLSASDEEDVTVKKILEYIARDEERHEEILRRAIEVASTEKY